MDNKRLSKLKDDLLQQYNDNRDFSCVLLEIYRIKNKFKKKFGKSKEFKKEGIRII